MQSRNHKPTSQQKAWHQWLATQRCVSCGDLRVSLHHCAGASARHNGVWIGQWWVIPVCYEDHQGPLGLHATAMLAGMPRKDAEKQFFARLWPAFERDAGHFVPRDVVMAIEDYRR